MKVTGYGANWQATYDFLLGFHCNYVSLCCIVSNILSFIFPKFNKVMSINTTPSGAIYLVLSANLHTKVEMPSFTQSKDNIQDS